MKKLTSSLLAVASASFMFWYVAYPNGVQLCNSATPFRTGTDSQANIAAAAQAKDAFCRTVALFPKN